MTLTEKLLVGAMLAQLALTFGLMLWLGRVRVTLITSREVKLRDIALDRSKWPPRAQQLANAVDNQFQLPVLFYLAVIVSLWSGMAGWLEVGVACAFVLLRIGHAAIHTTNNRVDRRFFVWTAGFAVLIALWALVGGKILFAGSA